MIPKVRIVRAGPADWLPLPTRWQSVLASAALENSPPTIL
jgi:hypothetical protein